MTNKDEALKPCPFCQGNAFYNFTDAGADRKYYRVHCSKCDAGIGHPYISKDAARESWNARALTEAPKVDELISEVRNCPAIKDQMNISDQSRTAVNIALSRAIDHLTTHYDLVKKESK